MNEWTGPVGEPTLAGLMREFPAWEFYQAFGWRCARLRSDPDVTVRGEDLMDLRDSIRRFEGTRA